MTPPKKRNLKLSTIKKIVRSEVKKELKKVDKTLRNRIVSKISKWRGAAPVEHE